MGRGAGLVTQVQLKSPGAYCEGWSVTLTGVLWEWQPPPVLWSGLKELCPLQPEPGCPRGLLSLGSRAPWPWLQTTPVGLWSSISLVRLSRILEHSMGKPQEEIMDFLPSVT